MLYTELSGILTRKLSSTKQLVPYKKHIAKVAVVVALQLAADLQQKTQLLECWQQKAEDLNSLLNEEFKTE